MEASQHVGIYLYNSPEFLFVWMGLLSIGAAPALLNYNLGSDALVHCVRLAATEWLIYDAAQDCTDRIEGVDEQLRNMGVVPIVLSDALKEEIARNPAKRPESSCFQDGKSFLPFALMYTR